MPAVTTGFLSVILLIAAVTTSAAQPLTLGSTREAVMKVVYRKGAHTDTLRRGSYLMEQLRMYPDTGTKQSIHEIVRIAPVRMFEMDGYATFVFDSTGVLHSYTWIRGDMKRFVLGAEWENVLTWTNDVTHVAYLGVKEQLGRDRPGARWTDKPEHQFARTAWYSDSSHLGLSWEHGRLILTDERR